MRTWLALVLVLAGCDKLFSLVHVPDEDQTDGGVACGADCDAPLGPPPRLLISELSVAGLDGTCSYDDTDEFVEIYNPEPVDANVVGLYLECSSLTSTAFIRCGDLPKSVTIAAHGYYLIANTGYLGDSCGYVGRDPDVVVNSVLTPDAGAVRLMGAGVELDRVAWGANPGGEGNALSPWPAAGWSQYFNSVERKASATSTAASMANAGAEATAGNGYDSGDNRADFVYRNGRDPQSSLSAAEP
ncbi:MAG TPA: hypothetical protein VLB44_11220 [Kofleriaceae bacterium]|nr:hypothetical protein [Kofleriaceae bacterium]